MDRRQVISAAGVGIAAAASAFPKPAIAQGVRELKMITTWPKNLPGLGTSAERVAQSITALSCGRLQVKVLGAGQLVNAFESFDAVSSGLADMYHGAEYYWEGRSAAFSYFAAVPFGLTAAEMNAWVYYGGGQALWDELSAGFGLKPFLCGNTGVQMGGWFTRELTGIEFLQGVTLSHAGPWWRGAAAARRRGGQPAGWRDHPVAAVGRHRRERMGWPMGRHGAGDPQGGQPLLLSRLPRAWNGAVPRRQQEVVGLPRTRRAQRYRYRRSRREQPFVGRIQRQECRCTQDARQRPGDKDPQVR